MVQELKTHSTMAQIAPQELTLVSLMDVLGTQYVQEGVPASASVYFVKKGTNPTPWEIDPIRLLDNVRVHHATQTRLTGSAQFREGGFTVSFALSEDGISCFYLFDEVREGFEPVILFHLRSFARHRSAADCEMVLSKTVSVCRDGKTSACTRSVFTESCKQISLPQLPSEELEICLASCLSGRGILLGLSQMQFARVWMQDEALWISLVPSLKPAEGALGAQPCVRIEPV